MGVTAKLVRQVLGFDLVELRAERGASQRQLARDLGITRTTLWRWETGTRTPMLPQLAHLLACVHPDRGAA